MKMMGLPSWMHWLCWYLNCATTSLISIIIMVALVSISFSSGLFEMDCSPLLSKGLTIV